MRAVQRELVSLPRGQAFVDQFAAHAEAPLQLPAEPLGPRGHRLPFIEHVQRQPDDQSLRPPLREQAFDRGPVAGANRAQRAGVAGQG